MISFNKLTLYIHKMHNKKTTASGKIRGSIEILEITRQQCTCIYICTRKKQQTFQVYQNVCSRQREVFRTQERVLKYKQWFCHVSTYVYNKTIITIIIILILKSTYYFFTITGHETLEISFEHTPGTSTLAATITAHPSLSTPAVRSLGGEINTNYVCSKTTHHMFSGWPRH